MLVGVELESGDRPISRYSTIIALRIHMQLGDYQCFRQLDHKVDTSQDEAADVMQDGLRYSNAYVLQYIGRRGI